MTDVYTTYKEKLEIWQKAYAEFARAQENTKARLDDSLQEQERVTVRLNKWTHEIEEELLGAARAAKIITYETMLPANADPANFKEDPYWDFLGEQREKIEEELAEINKAIGRDKAEYEKVKKELQLHVPRMEKARRLMNADKINRPLLGVLSLINALLFILASGDVLALGDMNWVNAKTIFGALAASTFITIVRVASAGSFTFGAVGAPDARGRWVGSKKGVVGAVVMMLSSAVLISVAIEMIALFLTIREDGTYVLDGTGTFLWILLGLVIYPIIKMSKTHKERKQYRAYGKFYLPADQAASLKRASSLGPFRGKTPLDLEATLKECNWLKVG